MRKRRHERLNNFPNIKQLGIVDEICTQEVLLFTMILVLSLSHHSGVCLNANSSQKSSCPTYYLHRSLPMPAVFFFIALIPFDIIPPHMCICLLGYFMHLKVLILTSALNVIELQTCLASVLRFTFKDVHLCIQWSS